MCTVSWLHLDGAIELFCNRDEKKTRATARAPEVIDSDAVRFIAPIDRAGGGTWIAVNEYGLVLCLLNGPNLGLAPDQAPVNSRGRIVVELAVAKSVTDACVRVSRVPVSDFAPFRLVLLERGRSATVVAWDGASRSILNPGGNFLSSSSVDDAGAQHVRKRGFEFFTHQQGMTVVEAHLAFHASHGAEASAYSACMHRPDAETVSFTRVKVTGSEVVVRYSPASPCRQYPSDVRRLAIAH